MAVQSTTQPTAPPPSPRSPQRLVGEVITRDHAAYETARRVWNGMIDKRPAVIARCADADDITVAVRFAAEHGLPLAVRGGGHNVAGTAVVDDGLVIDLSAMRAVRVDDSGGTVHVQGGATWADVDRVTQPLGLATPGGIVSETGVAGLALSGGVSSQRRLHGMTIDNLVSAEIVLADGRQVRASADEHADLHWAIRGGGGNFGIVTSFELRLHALGPDVFALNVAYPVEDAAHVLAGWRDAVADAPDELTTEGFLWTLPVIPDLPEHLRGLPYVGVSGMYAGTPDDGERLTRPLRELATPLLDMSETVPYLDLQRTLDPFFPAGLRLLLEGALPRRTPGRRHRADGRQGPAPPIGPDGRRDPPRRRRDRARRRRAHGVRGPRLRVHAEHRLDLGRPRRRRTQHRLDARLLERRTPLLPAREGLPQLPRPARGGRRGRAQRATAPTTTDWHGSRPATTPRTSSA